MRMTKLVVSFNRHYFVLAVVAGVAGIGLAILVENIWIKSILIAGVGLAAYFVIASVIASYFAYDASDLYQLRWWPAKCLDRSPSDGVVVHAGFDPSSSAIRSRYPDMHLRVLNFFDADTTTEASIQRAHRLFSSPGTEERIAPDCWPMESASQDVVFAVSAAHELRHENERIAFFHEARRILKRDGTIVVVEQLRDLVNFACFGAAVFHFLSRRTWMRSFNGANLKLTREFALSPWMRVFVLQPN